MSTRLYLLLGGDGDGLRQKFDTHW